MSYSERSVRILRSKEAGTFCLNPVGTFKGHGAYIGIPPKRLLGEGSSPKQIGELIVDLMELSGPTGCHIRDQRAYTEEHSDEETLEARKLFHDTIKTQRDLSRRFDSVGVSQRKGQKSWAVIGYTYSAKYDADLGEHKVLVPCKHGEAALGQAVLDMLVVE